MLDIIVQKAHGFAFYGERDRSAPRMHAPLAMGAMSRVGNRNGSQQQRAAPAAMRATAAVCVRPRDRTDHSSGGRLWGLLSVFGELL
jgi:hypothetical protein